ncbi:two-component sensor histidine kinase, partial [Streptomyces sp. SID7499]|nr:two-component sensor histidine kinase [Streptomyces sp. SID7499]
MLTSIRPDRDAVALAVSGLLGGVLLWLLGLHTQGGHPFSAPWATLVPLTAMAAAELLRRNAPRAALTIGVLALVTDQFTRGSLATVLMFTDVMYAAVLYGTPAAARRLPVAT